MNDLHEKLGNRFPETWTSITLEKIASFIDYRGRTPVKTESGVPLITAKNVKMGYLSEDPQEYINYNDYDSWMTRGIPENGDILFTTEGPLGNVAQIDIEGKFALAQRVITIQPFAPIIKEYIKYILMSPQFQRELELNSTGTTVKGIKSSVLKKMVIPLPPIGEQKRIVEKLDWALRNLDEIESELKSIETLLEKRNLSLLSTRLNGNSNAEWKDYKLGEIVDFIGGSQPPKSEFEFEKTNSNIRLVQIRDFRNDDNITYIPKEKARRLFNNDDVMIGRYGPPVFQILRGLEGAYNVALMKAVPNEEVLSKDYLYYLLQEPTIQRIVTKDSQRSAGQSGVNKDLLTNINVMVPSLETQQIIIRNLEYEMNIEKDVLNEVNNVLGKVKKMRKSLLHRAFKGDLVEQQLSEGTGQELLGNISKVK